MWRTIVVCLHLQNISKRFGNTLALQNLDWKLDDGQLGIVLGPSGSGKTTLLKIIAGLLHTDSGDILFDNNSVLEQKASERKVGYVPQSLGLFPHLTVRQNLSFGLEAQHWKKRDIKERVRELLSLGEIEDLSERYPREISGGQQQRVALLRALAPRPQILLLDEPLGSLDIQLRSRMLRVIKNIQKLTRTTTVLVSHNPQETILDAENVLVIEGGRAIQTGTPQDLIHRPAISATAILGVKNVFDATVISMQEDRVKVETPFGSIWVTMTETNKPNKLRGIRIPPSRIEIFSEKKFDSDTISVEGTISQVTYLGDQAEISLEISGSDILLFVSIDSHELDSNELETGNLLTCMFSPSHVKLLWDKNSVVDSQR